MIVFFLTRKYKCSFSRDLRRMKQLFIKRQYKLLANHSLFSYSII